MTTKHRSSLLVLVAALTAAGLAAQTTGTPAGSSATGTTNSGGVAPATGKPTVTPTGPTAGGTGSGTVPPSPTIGGNTTVGGNVTMGGNTTGGNVTTPPVRGVGKGPNENASDTAKAVHAVIADFQKQRDTYLASRQALLDSLKKAATDAERQTILEQLRKDNQDRETEERNLGKQIRDELKKLRDARKTGG
jgi:hypothetical protein